MTAKTSTKPKQSEVKKEAKDASSLLIPNSTVTITLKKADVAKTYEKVLASLAKKVNVSGFRKGKVPGKVAEEYVGQAKVVEYVLDELIPAAYQAAIVENKKTPITRPEFSVTSAEMGKDWVIEAYFSELPEVSISKYETHVKNGVKEAAKVLAEQKKEAEKKETKDGEKKETAPTSAEQEKETRLQYIFRELVTQLKPKVPELLLKHETQHEFEHIVDQLKQINITVDDYLKRRGISMEDLSQELAVSTISRLQLDLLLGAIAKEKKLEVTNEDKEKYFAEIKDEKLREQLKKDTHYTGHLETNLMKQKVVDHLLSLA